MPLRIMGYQNLMTNSLPLVQAGLGCILCVEGAWRLREAPGFTFLPVTPERVAAHRLVRKKNRLLSRTAESFWRFASDHWQA